MDCVLIRHGIAVERDEWNGSDTDRPLTERGAKRVVQVGAGLKWTELRPTQILSSPLIRAVETADILRKVLRVRPPLRLVDELLPDAAPDRVLALLHELPQESCVLCVGHEPHLGKAAGVMLAGKSSTAFPLKKAGACLIEMPAAVQPGQGILRWWMEPGQLRALGKKQERENVSGA